MKITLRGVRTAASLVLAVAALGGCYSTGTARCDRLLQPQADRAARYHYTINCKPPADWQPHLGWADHKTKTLWIWSSRISDDRVVRKVAWHEVGHVVARHRGLTFATQAADERWADAWAWCKEPIYGVSYLAMPTNCAPYLP